MKTETENLHRRAACAFLAMPEQPRDECSYSVKPLLTAGGRIRNTFMGAPVA